MPEEVSPQEAARRERDAARSLMRALPEFQNLCGFVLDACVFNLVEEASYGEEDLSGAPPVGGNVTDLDEELYDSLDEGFPPLPLPERLRADAGSPRRPATNVTTMSVRTAATDGGG